MQVYRLEPKNGDISDRNWEASTVKEECWVRAESESDARLKAAFATGMATRIEPGKPNKTSPWQIGTLTTCVPDNTPGRQPPLGVLLWSKGTITIPGHKATRSAE